MIGSRPADRIRKQTQSALQVATAESFARGCETADELLYGFCTARRRLEEPRRVGFVHRPGRTNVDCQRGLW